MEENEWLTIDEVASHLKVKRTTIYKWIERHDLPAHKAADKLWRFRRNEVDRWVTDGKAPGPDVGLDSDSITTPKNETENETKPESEPELEKAK